VFHDWKMLIDVSRLHQSWKIFLGQERLSYWL
jgi:hypothetical protein